MNLIFCMFWCCFWWGSLAHNFHFMNIGEPNSTVPAHNNNFIGHEGLGEPNSIASALNNNYIRHVFVGKPNLASSSLFKYKWFEQKLDHFNPTDSRTWKQRYIINSQYYKRGGPVFLSIEGEKELGQEFTDSGSRIELADTFNALCIQLEHRFYGKSQPTENLNTTNLVYLTIDQALADLETFISTIKMTHKNVLHNAKWVAFGGSYPGLLAVYARMKYPHLVHAAVSSSGSFKSEINYKGYYTVVQKVLSDYNPKCVSNIKDATVMITDLLKTDDGVKYIEKKFKLCNHLNINNKNDVSHVFYQFAGGISNVVQYNRDNRYYGNIQQSSMSLVKICDIMLDKSLGNTLARYAVLQEELRSVDKASCFGSNYQNLVSFLVTTSWEKWEKDVGYRQWLYQECTELGDFTASHEDNFSLFGDTLPIEYYIEGLCSDVFGKSFDLNALKKSIDRINTRYQYLQTKQSRIIYTRGSIDPYNAAGMTELKAENSISILIEGTSHCADLGPSSTFDPPELTKAHKTIKSYLKRWLN